MSRIERINSELRKQLNVIFAEGGFRDPRIKGMLTAMEVSVDTDLTLAKVYVSVYGAKGEEKQVLEGLDAAQGYIRSRLKDMIKLRALPKFRFVLDTSIDYGMKMDKFLSSLNPDGSDR